MQEAADLMASEQVDVKTWPTPVPLSHGVEAFDRALRAEGGDIKMILVP